MFIRKSLISAALLSSFAGAGFAGEGLIGLGANQRDPSQPLQQAMPADRMDSMDRMARMDRAVERQSDASRTQSMGAGPVHGSMMQGDRRHDGVHSNTAARSLINGDS